MELRAAPRRVSRTIKLCVIVFFYYIYIFMLHLLSCLNFHSFIISSILLCLKVPSKDPRRIGLLPKAASRCAQRHELGSGLCSGRRPGLWPAVHVAVHSLCMLSLVCRTLLALGSPLVTVDLSAVPFRCRWAWIDGAAPAAGVHRQRQAMRRSFCGAWHAH